MEQSDHEFHRQTNLRLARTVASTQSEMTEIILPNDTNTLGNLLGGRLMHFIDLTGAMAAYRHSRTYMVTAAMDHIDFIRPVHLGDLLTLKSSVNRAFTTSMEVGVKVWAENTQTGVGGHVASAYLVFVAIDKQGRRQHVPATACRRRPTRLRRYADALLRREHREAESRAPQRRAKLATAAQEERSESIRTAEHRKDSYQTVTGTGLKPLSLNAKRSNQTLWLIHLPCLRP